MDFLSVIKNATFNGGIKVSELLEICKEKGETQPLRKIRCLITAGLVVLIKDKKTLRATERAFNGL